MKIKTLISIFLFVFAINLSAQNINYAQKIICDLSSEKYLGRGYDSTGNFLAAQYIENELKNFNISKFKKSYSQEFSLNTNSIFGDLTLISGKDTLLPGIEYIVSGNSGTLNGKFEVKTLNAEILKSTEKFAEFQKTDFSKKFILIDTFGLNDKNFKEKYSEIAHNNSLKACAIIEITGGNLTYVPSQNQTNFVNIILKKEFSEKITDSVSINIETELLKNVKTQNIIGFIKGEIDTFIVYTAHYDHIGTMGKATYFPGANDNASGTAMVLSLAKYYSQLKEKPKYSIAFIFFSGEELGLLGSKYYTENPKFPLSKIKYLINLDMVGSGDKGIQIVNGAVFKDDFENLVKINKEKNYLPDIKKRGAAANSDHYFFYSKGVKSFFIYTLGEYKEYHNINDKAENLPLTAFNNLILLLIDFEKLTSKNPK
jgi:hypothetical protein